MTQKCKLIIQLPCFNEQDTLAQTIADLPREIRHVDKVEFLVVDDGSTDNTSEVAKKAGVDHVIRLTQNRGLANAFSVGLSKSIELGADIIVNTDGDGQYRGSDIADLVQPIIEKKADIVIGDRDPKSLQGYTGVKRILHKIGTKIVCRLAGVDVPDPVSGFRAISKESAIRINIMSSFSYTTEMIIQAGIQGMKIVSIPIKTNPATRPSRLFKSVPQFIFRTARTIIRTYVLYKPLRVFCGIGVVFFVIGMFPIIRFLTAYISEGGAGHVQSLVLGGMLVIISFITFLFGILADVQARNRMLIEKNLEETRKLSILVRAKNLSR